MSETEAERMDNQEYKDTQNMLLAMASSCSELRLELFLGRITEANILGAGKSPQLWEQTKNILQELERLAKSAQEMKESMIRIALLQKNANSGGRILRLGEGGHA